MFFGSHHQHHKHKPITVIQDGDPDGNRGLMILVSMLLLCVLAFAAVAAYDTLSDGPTVEIGGRSGPADVYLAPDRTIVTDSSDLAPKVELRRICNRHGKRCGEEMWAAKNLISIDVRKGEGPDVEYLSFIAQDADVEDFPLGSEVDKDTLLRLQQLGPPTFEQILPAGFGAREEALRWSRDYDVRVDVVAFRMIDGQLHRTGKTAPLKQAVAAPA